MRPRRCCAPVAWQCGVACRPTLPLFSRLPTHRQGLFQGLWTGVGCGLAGLLGERRAKGNPGGGAACWAAPHMLWRGGAGVEREGERRAHCRQTLQRLIPLYSATPAETVCFFVLTTVLLALPGGILYGSHGPIVLFRVSGRWRWAAAGPHRTRMQSCVVHFATAGQRPDTIPAPSLPHTRLSALPTRRNPRLRPGDPRVHRRGGRPHAGGAPPSQGSRGTGPAAQPRVAGRPGVAGAVSRLARPRPLPLCCGNHDGVVRPHGSLSRPVSSPLVPFLASFCVATHLLCVVPTSKCHNDVICCSPPGLLPLWVCLPLVLRPDVLPRGWLTVLLQRWGIVRGRWGRSRGIRG